MVDPQQRPFPDAATAAARIPLPLNRQRAHAVLEKHGLDGIVALRPHNVYYLSNSWPVAVDFGSEFPAMATFAADPSQPGFFICTPGAALEVMNGDREVLPVITYTGAENWRDYVGAGPERMRVEPQAFGAATPFGFAVRSGIELTAREAAWDRAQVRHNPTSAPSPEWALVRALKESGLINGRIAVDDMRVARLLAGIGVDTVTVLPGDNIFRDIRLIKQPHEITLMRQAQKASRAAAMAAARGLVPGMTYAEARALFVGEAARHGAELSFLLLGMSQAMLPDGVVRSGRSYMIDCGASFSHYMGDFARTIAIGEPSAELARRMAAQQAARAAALEIIRPGVRFSAVEALARAVMVKAGMPSHVIAACSLHSVGLQHDDQPHRTDVFYRVPVDLTLEAGMCVTLDLPFLEIGWGAGHNEDLLLLTANGHELLNDPGDPLVIV
ncbi:MAG: M24 family metallopeptidase [Azospirillaceae bacterium]|nr:M24 family metallopeptidase [Azospirillaceae bacterium]